MNRKNRQALAFLPIVIGAALLSDVHAASFTYSKGDLLMGFYESGATNTYIVDLGAASTYRDATSSFAPNIGNIGADLSTVFGSGWATDSNLQWGIFGANYQTAVNGDAIDTLYASSPEQILGQQADAFTAETARVQASPASLINTLGNDAGTGNPYSYTTTANSNFGVIENSTDVGSFAYYQNTNGTQSFSYFNGALAGGFSGSELPNSALDLFRMAPANAGSSGSYEGTFTISSSGTVTFNPMAVPEPSTVACFVFGGTFLLLLARKRRTLDQAS